MEYKSTISQQRIHTFTYLTLTYVFMVRRTIQYRTVNAHKNAILYHTTHMYVHMHMYPDAWAFSINYKSADRSTFTMYRTNEPRNIYDLPNERRNLPNQKPQIIYRTHEETWRTTSLSICIEWTNESGNLPTQRDDCCSVIRPSCCFLLKPSIDTSPLK